jgi:hypothetical protein
VGDHHLRKRVLGTVLCGVVAGRRVHGHAAGELDALRWERVDFDRDRIIVAEQFNAATRKFDTPKNHQRREAPLTAHARSALEGVARESEFCFVSLRGEHWTPSTRAYHWKAVRAAARWDGSLYPATRQFAGWYMVNGQRPRNALRGRSDRARPPGRRQPRPASLRARDKHRALDRIVGAYAANAGESRPKPQESSGVVSPQESLF